jgi:hypothetical protein
VKVIALVFDWLFSHSFASDVVSVVVFVRLADTPTDTPCDAKPKLTPASIVELTEVDTLEVIVVL